MHARAKDGRKEGGRHSHARLNMSNNGFLMLRARASSTVTLVDLVRWDSGMRYSIWSRLFRMVVTRSVAAAV